MLVRVAFDVCMRDIVDVDRIVQTRRSETVPEVRRDDEDSGTTLAHRYPPNFPVVRAVHPHFQPTARTDPVVRLMAVPVPCLHYSPSNTGDVDLSRKAQHATEQIM